MKSLLLVAALITISASVPTYAQFDYTPDSLITTTITFNKSFPVVWKAVLKCVKDKGCAVESRPQTFDEKTETYKGNVRSEACVLVVGEDSTRDVLQRWGKVPMIRGGVWVAGRAQYNFSVRDMPDKTVEIVMTIELSGNENYITNQVHFWHSNGVLDDEMLSMLKLNLGDAVSVSSVKTP